MNVEKITYEVKNDIAYIGFGKHEEKSLTTLSKDALAQLQEAIDKVSNDSSLKGLIFFSHKKECFLAGVDVEIIRSLDSESIASQGASDGQEIFNKIEDLKIPTMALINGFCLGGGLELSLSCNKIMVSDSKSTKLGLPEVMLGVLPGFGGTYRLPRKIGLTKSLDMMLTGRQLNSKRAYKQGLADYVVPYERMLELAPSYLFKEKKDKKSFSDKAKSFAEDSFVGRKIIFQKAREGVLSKTKGFYPAPLRIIEILENHGTKKRAAYLSKEAKAFGELSQTIQSKNLVNLFFMQDDAKKKQGSTTREINKGSVLGAGTMGGGIAWYFAQNNIPSYMKDINEAGLNLGLKQASANFSKALKRKRMTADTFQRKMRSITPTMSYNGFKSVDLTIEAIVEDMQIKKNVLAELENYVEADSIITSNTSSLSINELSSSLKNPERFAGLHFFNPVNKMPLVEIITHEKSDPEVIKRLYDFTLKCKKTPVVVKDGPGFLVNRILGAYLNEAGHLLAEGVSVEDIDKAALDFGMPMGPCHLIDEVGIDVSIKVGKILFEGLGDRFKSSDALDSLISKKLLGKKGSLGFYHYDNKGKKGSLNSDLEGVFSKSSKVYDMTQLQKRLIYPMINEASYCLDEGIVNNAKYLDLAMIFGIGFPPFRGGLLKYADHHGVFSIKEDLENFSKIINEHRFKVSSYLKNLCDKKVNFYS